VIKDRELGLPDDEVEQGCDKMRFHYVVNFSISVNNPPERLDPIRTYRHHAWSRRLASSTVPSCAASRLKTHSATRQLRPSPSNPPNSFSGEIPGFYPSPPSLGNPLETVKNHFKCDEDFAGIFGVVENPQRGTFATLSIVQYK